MMKGLFRLILSGPGAEYNCVLGALAARLAEPHQIQSFIFFPHASRYDQRPHRWEISIGNDEVPAFQWLEIYAVFPSKPCSLLNAHPPADHLHAGLEWSHSEENYIAVTGHSPQ